MLELYLPTSYLMKQSLSIAMAHCHDSSAEWNLLVDPNLRCFFLFFAAASTAAAPASVQGANPAATAATLLALTVDSKSMDGARGFVRIISLQNISTDCLNSSAL